MGRGRGERGKRERRKRGKEEVESKIKEAEGEYWRRKECKKAGERRE